MIGHSKSNSDTENGIIPLRRVRDTINISNELTGVPIPYNENTFIILKNKVLL